MEKEGLLKEYPNTLYLRIQQPDLSGATFNKNNIWWYDICSVLISNIIDRSAALGPLNTGSPPNIHNMFDICYNKLTELSIHRP